MWLTPFAEQAKRDQTQLARMARLRGDYAKTQATKAQILNALTAEPALHAEKIAEIIGKTPPYTRKMLNRLYAESKVDSWKERTGAHSWVQKWIVK